MVTVPYFNNLVVPDNIVAQGSVAIENWLETWTHDRKNWPKDELVSVSPIFDGITDKTIIIGRKMTLEDWELHY